MRTLSFCLGVSSYARSATGHKVGEAMPRPHGEAPRVSLGSVLEMDRLCVCLVLPGQAWSPAKVRNPSLGWDMPDIPSI